MGFNTLYVVGSNRVRKLVTEALNVSIHYMSLVQKAFISQHRIDLQVSIHYMSLVQITVKQKFNGKT